MSDKSEPKIAIRMGVILAALIVLYITFRILAIFTPSQTLWSVMVDEIPTGNIAHDLGQGDRLVLYWPLYQIKPFAAGTIIEGIVSYPFTQIFGHSLFALKCSAICFGLVTMILWFLLLWRYFGGPAATFSGLLFVFAPFGYLNLTTTAWGNHTETALFTVLCLHLLFAAYYNKNPARTPMPLYPFLAGFAAGFGTYFAYTGAITLAFGLVLIVLIGGTVQWRGPVWLYLLGAVVGFAPIVFSIRAFELESLGRIDTYTGYSAGSLILASDLFLESGIGKVISKLFFALVRDLPRSFCFPERFGIEGVYYSYIFYSLLVALFAGLVYSKRQELKQLFSRLFSGKKNRENVSALMAFSIPGFILFFLVAFSLSGFRVINTPHPDPSSFVEFRYFAPLYPFLFALMGLSFSAVIHAFSFRPLLRAGFFAFGAVLILFMGSMHLGLEKYPPNFRAMEVRGDFYLLTVDKVAQEISKNEKHLPGKQQWMEQLAPVDRPLFFESISAINPEGFDIAVMLAKRTDEAYLKNAYRGFGLYVGREVMENSGGDPVGAINQVLTKYSDFSGENRHFFLDGVGEGMFFTSKRFYGSEWNQASFFDSPGLRESLSSKDSEALMTGLGRGIGQVLTVFNLQDVTPPAGFWNGVGRQMRRNAHYQLLRNDIIIDSIQYLPGGAISPLLHGWSAEGRDYFAGKS